MKIAIVDDEREWRDRIAICAREYLNQHDVVIVEYDNGEALIQAEEAYDIVMLDIEMDGIDGFETARRYKTKYPSGIVILLTAHDELMEFGYSVGALRYVSKSRMPERLEEALEAADRQLRLKEPVDFMIKGYGSIKVSIKNVIYIETEKRNAVVHTTDSKFVCTENMDDIEMRLQDKGFFRCHRGVLVSLDHVVKYDNISIYMSNNDVVPISVRRVKPFKEAFIKRKFEYANS